MTAQEYTKIIKPKINKLESDFHSLIENFEKQNNLKIVIMPDKDKSHGIKFNFIVRSEDLPH